MMFRLREQLPQIQAILAYPIEGFIKAWTVPQREPMPPGILPEYSETVCVAQNGGSKAYLVRDRYV